MGEKNDEKTKGRYFVGISIFYKKIQSSAKVGTPYAICNGEQRETDREVRINH